MFTVINNITNIQEIKNPKFELLPKKFKNRNNEKCQFTILLDLLNTIPNESFVVLTIYGKQIGALPGGTKQILNNKKLESSSNTLKREINEELFLDVVQNIEIIGQTKMKFGKNTEVVNYCLVDYTKLSVLNEFELGEIKPDSHEKVRAVLFGPKDKLIQLLCSRKSFNANGNITGLNLILLPKNTYIDLINELLSTKYIKDNQYYVQINKLDKLNHIKSKKTIVKENINKKVLPTC